MTLDEALMVLSDTLEGGRMDRVEQVVAAIKGEMVVTELGSENPWSRSTWHGKWVSIDGADTTGFEVDADNILLVIAYGSTPTHDWDGDAAGIVLLDDGRFCAWESSWGPTGSGFCDDAYGGDADVGFAMTLEAATRYISERGRELLKYLEPK